MSPNKRLLQQNNPCLQYVLRFVSFDIATSEICRDIDPKSDGMMLGMVITADSRFTAAFTKYVIFLLDLNNLKYMNLASYCKGFN